MLLRSLARLVPRPNLPTMTGHLYLDTSPPAYAGARDHLDKSAFHKTLPVLAVRVRPNKIGKFLKGDAMKRQVELLSTTILHLNA